MENSPGKGKPAGEEGNREEAEVGTGSPHLLLIPVPSIPSEPRCSQGWGRGGARRGDWKKRFRFFHPCP
jgi:hypothetical protein